jgi:hypothetical protein
MLSDATSVAQVPADSPDSGEIPLACSLTSAELEVRGEENGALFAHATAVEELPDGYRFAFPAEAESATAILRFVLAERDCCPFFTFDLAFTPPHQAIWLTIGGSEAIKGIVQDTVLRRVNC